MRLAFAILLLAVSHAAAAPTITFTKGPEDKYRCTRYAPGLRSNEPLRVFAPPGKPMIFSFAASASDRSKVAYRAEGLPPGATVDAKGTFNWQIPATAKGSWTVALVAESPTAKATQSFALAIADPDLVAAWRAGMGSYEPDCTRRIDGYDFIDLDNDHKTDLVYWLRDERDDSASPDTPTHVHRRTATGFDTVERTLSTPNLDAVTLPDGKPAFVATRSCCCMKQVWVYRLTATGVDELGGTLGDSCSGSGPELQTNAKGQLYRIVTRAGDPPTETFLVWRDGKFEPK